MRSDLTARNPSTVTEPHPSLPRTGAYLNGGRGGAGNFSRYNFSDLTPGPNASGPASRVPLNTSRKPTSHKQPSTVPIGRGGAGNMFKPSHSDGERVFQFDEEILRRREQEAPVYHFGRGGVANFADERRSSMQAKDRRQGSVVSARSEASSTASSGSERVRDVFERVVRRF